MRALLQRVKNASVQVDRQKIAQIGKGVVILLGITHGDNEKDISYLVEKITNLRIFEGESGKLDLSLLDTKGEILLVSQFTLYGSCEKGRRPDFALAAHIEEAKQTYNQAVDLFSKCGLKVKYGQFQSHMEVELINDGPLTLMLESKKNHKSI